MRTTAYTATFADGTTVTRRTEATYVCASKDHTGRVRFHKACPAARRDREVVAVEGGAAAAAPAAPAAERTITVTFADGTTATAPFDTARGPVASARAAFPDARITGIKVAA